MLYLLSLLQTRRDWPGSLLASRLKFSDRTVRRDVDRLSAMGYRIQATMGPEGGYRLDAGHALPPLLGLASAARTGVEAYFCDSHSPWQRGTCENTNGLLRQYLPQVTGLSVYSQEELDAIADSLNTRPCAAHGFQSPLVAFARMLALTHLASTSTH